MAYRKTERAGMKPLRIEGGTFIISKVDEDERLVFGFFSIVTKDGKLIKDADGETIEPSELEAGAYRFVLKARKGSVSHTGKEVGQLVESCAFTVAKQEAMQTELRSQGFEKATIDLTCDAWWGGFYISDDAVWKGIKDGEYPCFSIGGMATSEELPADTPVAA